MGGESEETTGRIEKRDVERMEGGGIRTRSYSRTRWGDGLWEREDYRRVQHWEKQQMELKRIDGSCIIH